MGLVTLYAEKYAYVEAGGAGDSHSNTLQPIGSLTDPHFLLRFPALNSSLKYRAIQSITLKLGVSGRYRSEIHKEEFVSDDFNAATVSYSSIPTDANGLVLNKAISTGAIGSFDKVVDTVLFSLGSGSGFLPRTLLEKKTCVLSDFFREWTNPSELSIYTPLVTPANASTRPRLEIYCSDANVGVIDPHVSAFDYINPHVANTLSISFELSSLTLESLSVTQESFFWREVGASTWNEIQLTPGATSVTIPAETFPAASSVEYFVRITCNSGVSTDSNVPQPSTADTAATATPESPVSTVEAGNEPIVFKWNVSNASGSVQTKSELQYSEDDGTTWTALATLNGAATTYAAAANTFSAGPVKWRVRAYNIDGVAGDWSTASFVALSAPDAPAVQSSAVPFATITWQGSGQQAYQIEIDGEDLGTFFGEKKIFQVKTPLTDGSHTARVRIQNRYGLWSVYGATAFTIENDPGDDIILDGIFSVDAALSWFTDSTTADFLIFRDGALIGHTAGNSFIDRFVLGEHSYYVINRLPSGNYSRSNTVTGRMCVRRPTVTALDGGEWIELKYSEKSMPEQRFTWSRTHSLRHIAGAKWPVLEVSPFEDLSGTYDAAFLCACDAAAFRTLRGKVVIMKSRDGKVVIGALVNVSEVVNAFYLSMQFTIEQIHWEDYVDDADG